MKKQSINYLIALLVSLCFILLPSMAIAQCNGTCATPANCSGTESCTRTIIVSDNSDPDGGGNGAYPPIYGVRIRKVAALRYRIYVGLTGNHRFIPDGDNCLNGDKLHISGAQQDDLNGQQFCHTPTAVDTNALGSMTRGFLEQDTNITNVRAYKAQWIEFTAVSRMDDSFPSSGQSGSVVFQVKYSCNYAADQNFRLRLQYFKIIFNGSNSTSYPLNRPYTDSQCIDVSGDYCSFAEYDLPTGNPVGYYPYSF